MAEENEDLLTYSSDEEDTGVAAAAPKAAKGSHVSLHSAAFRDFGLKPELLRAISDCGFEHPSEVQHECLPQAINGTDIICQAKSGMGKTAVFVLSTLQLLNPVDGHVSVLVLCNTRELAYQIEKEYQRFAKHMGGVKCAVFFGGLPVNTDIKTLEETKPHVVVGTPGRIWDLIERKKLDLSHLKQFVLDECDRLIEDPKSRAQVQQILLATPHEKQVMMFSATLAKEIRPTCKKFMQSPMEIYVNDESKLTLHGLQQHYVRLGEDAKNRKLVELLDALEFNQVVIFVKNVARARTLAALLNQQMFPAIDIHPGLKQTERLARFNAFKAFEHRILVATELFGRGIDIERVNIVVNFDMPPSSDAYLHRVARAGRFGTKGLAISFIASDDDAAILNAVQSRFEVDITDLPAHVDKASYIDTA